MRGRHLCICVHVGGSTDGAGGRPHWRRCRCRGRRVFGQRRRHRRVLVPNLPQLLLLCLLQLAQRSAERLSCFGERIAFLGRRFGQRDEFLGLCRARILSTLQIRQRRLVRRGAVVEVRAARHHQRLARVLWRLQPQRGRQLLDVRVVGGGGYRCWRRLAAGRGHPGDSGGDSGGAGGVLVHGDVERPPLRRCVLHTLHLKVLFFGAALCVIPSALRFANQILRHLAVHLLSCALLLCNPARLQVSAPRVLCCHAQRPLRLNRLLRTPQILRQAVHQST
mmetsp:Transcript_38594/g.95856  ORF Transcript_38594/g.95856 Transcript_38594/m.95856 type:complete len:279 (-) Transcript_38594:1496-2332(-)